jgi:tripartite-type tricarboxylate transporter receptor subunit TctC
MRQFFKSALMGALLSAASLAAFAQAPSGATYKIIVGFPPGQATDTVARLLAEKFSRGLNTSVIVDNKPGAGGSIGLGHLARSAPDGRTMMLTSQSGLVSNPHIQKDIKYDPLKDFEPIGLVADLPLLMVTAPNAPFDSVSAFLKQAQASPDTLTFASSGIGTTMHLYMLLLQRDTRVKMVHVPYQGSVAALTDVMAGRVSLGFDTIPATLPLIKAGKLKLLGVGANRPLDMLPGAPSVGAQAGLPDFDASAWLGLIYPKGTPPEAVAQINKQLAEALSDPAIRSRMETLGAIPRMSSPDVLGKRIRDDYFRWKDIVQQFNIN